jgi:hypothetical protein
MTITTTIGTWRAVLPRGNIAKAQVISDDASFPNGMFGVALIYGDSDEETAANAHLLAASKDLYRATSRLLKAADDAIDSGAFTGRKGFKRIENEYIAAEEEAKAALSKARGE